MPARQCLRCGSITNHPSKRGLCPACHREYERQRPARAVYDSPRWRRLQAAVLRQWVRVHGWLCPGAGRPAHPSHDLTVDHIVAVAAGGDPWAPSNLQVLCRSCNGRKAATPATSTEEPTP